jgi:hypothetical protein
VDAVLGERDVVGRDVRDFPAFLVHERDRERAHLRGRSRIRALPNEEEEKRGEQRRHAVS